MNSFSLGKNKKFKIWYFFVIAIVLFVSIILFMSTSFGRQVTLSFIYKMDRISSNPNEFVRHFSPTWRSVKKLVDLPYVIAYAFHKTDLPIYSLSLTQQDQANLLANLPDYPRESFLSDEFKVTVRGKFKAESYETDNADVRYRGNSPRHWNASKKSWHIQLPKENPLQERRILRLILPEDRQYIAEPLNAYRAKKLGLITPELSFARLDVNGKDMGVYLLMEGWEESFLEKNKKGLSALYTNKETSIDLYKPDGIDGWEDRFLDETNIDAKDQLEFLIKIVANSSDQEFEEHLPNILDMETFYNWTVINILAGSFQQNNQTNQNLYFNNATGKFEPVVFDVDLAEIREGVDVSENRLVNRVLQNTNFRNELEKRLISYVEKEENLIDDLSFYDNLLDKIKPEILSDEAKLPLSIEFLNEASDDRKIIERNFIKIREMLVDNKTLSLLFSNEEYPLDQYRFGQTEIEKDLMNISLSKISFLQNNAQFVDLGGRTVGLASGIHIFTKNVIVPKNLLLIIEAGAELYMAPETSIISYSPVKIEGGFFNQVKILPLSIGKPWGVFAVVDSSQKSMVSHTRISNGKDAFVNGIYFSGALSFHNADVDIQNLTILESHADDALHILSSQANIKQSSFFGNSADDIDIDFAERDSSIMDGFFSGKDSVGIGGDAIDLSFSDITIERNTITSCGDKGISIGESSTPKIKSIFVENCLIGIAIKDGSFTEVEDAYLVGNETGLSLYRKKPHFVLGGKGIASDIHFFQNEENILTDQYSDLNIEYNNISDINILVESLPFWLKNKHLLSL